MLLEFKKLIKSKKLFLIICFAFFMAVYVHVFSQKDSPISFKPSYLDKYRQFQVSDAESLLSTEILNEANEKSESGDSSLLDAFFSNEIKHENYIRQATSSNPLPKNYTEYQDLLKSKLEYMKDIDDIYKKFKVKVDPQVKSDWEFYKFEHKYALESSAMTISSNHSYLYDNLARRLVFNSDIYLGIGLILFFTLIFFDSLSIEKESGTYDLLFSQSKKSLLVYNKFLIIIFSLVIYMIFFLIFSLLISYLVKLPISGFNEIYRVFNKADELRYLSFYKVIFNIVFSAMLSIGLVMSVVLLISTWVHSSKENLSISLGLIFVMSVFTKHFPIFNFSINPFYKIDYYNRLLGSYEAYTDQVGNNLYRVIYADGNSNYLIFLVFTFLTLILTNHLFLNYRKNERKLIQNKFNKNMILFELKKIYLSNNFLAYLLLLSLLIFSIFLTVKDFNQNRRNFLLAEKGLMLHEKKALDQSTKDLEKQRKVILSKNSMASEEEINNYLARLIQMNAYHKDSYQSTKTINEAFRNSDGKTFYKSLYDRLAKSDKVSTYANYSESSEIAKAERLLILEYAGNNKIKPRISRDVSFSAYDKEENIYRSTQRERRNSIKSEASAILLQRFFKVEKFDSIILVFLLVTLLSGFCLDRENGSQIDLITTQPLASWKIYFNKLLAIFLWSFFIIIFAITLIVLIGGISEDFGAFDFPSIYYKTLLKNPSTTSLDRIRKSIEIVPLWLYTIRLVISLLCQVVFFASLTNTLSLFVKKQSNLIISVLIATLVMAALAKFSPVNIKLLNPFIYLRASSIADNSVMVFEKINGSVLVSNLVLLVWSILLSIVGFERMRKK